MTGTEWVCTYVRTWCTGTGTCSLLAIAAVMHLTWQTWAYYSGLEGRTEESGWYTKYLHCTYNTGLRVWLVNTYVHTFRGLYMHAENEEVFVRSALQPSVSVNTNLGFIYLDRTRRTSSCASSSVKKRLQRNKLQETRSYNIYIYIRGWW